MGHGIRAPEHIGEDSDVGVLILGLKRGVRRKLRIGGFVHTIGLIAPLWKVTETDLVPGRLEHLEALDAAERVKAVDTPKAVMVEAPVQFGSAVGSAHLVLGWDQGRLETQDFDFDFLPTLGHAVPEPGGEFNLHETADATRIPISTERARELGILSANGDLVRRGQPKISACRLVAGMPGGYFAAECQLEDGRTATVLGESESGDLPPTGWLVGKTPKDAARYRLASQIASKR